MHLATSLNYISVLPVWLSMALTVGLVAVLAHGSLVLLRKAVPGGWVAGLAVLRAAIVAVFLVCLFQPVVSFTHTAERRPDLLVLVDTSASMATTNAAGAGTRLDEARAALGGELGARLNRQYQLHWYAFDRTANPVEERDLAALRPAGSATHLGDSLAAALQSQQQLAGDGAPLASRVLLASDGVDNGTLDPIEIARRQSVAVDVLALGAGGAGPAAAAVTIVNVQAPRRVLLGSECELQATVRHEGAVTRPVSLNVFANDTLVAVRPVTFAAGQWETSLRLTHRPARPGLTSYAFVLAPAEVTVAEPTADAERVDVQVVDTRSEVLVLDDGWRWEFRFLRRVIEDDPSFNFTAFLPRGPGFVQFAGANRRATLTAFPQGRADLEAFDLVVLGNADPRRWPRGLSDELAHAVAEDGKSLIVLAGPNLPLLSRVGVIDALLPVEVTDESGKPVPGPVAVRPSVEGAGSPFLANLLTLSGSRQPLPPLDQIYPPLRKRPGATILLEAAQAANAYGNLIVMAEQTVGRGRVLFVGTDTLWKWQMLAEPNAQGQTPGSLFWQQALRAMVPVRPPSSVVALWLQAERTRYEAGRTVRLRAETDGDPKQSVAQLQAVVQLPDGRELPLAFTADAGQAGRFQAEFVTSIPGRYTVTAAILEAGKHKAEATTAIESRPPAAEVPNVPVDRAGLQRLASLTGGRVVLASDPATWPVEKATAHLTTQKTETLDLWNNFTLVLILCGLLATDWTLRLLRGFV